jgi:ATP-dependent RNA helicase RhlE
MKFEEMNLIAPLLTAVKASGYEEPTPIQSETIPLVLAGKDVLGCAQTGTGKTAAFALPILQRLWQTGKQYKGKRPIRALILTPTRELAMQILESFQTYGRSMPLRSCVVFGGVGQRPQVDQLNRGVDVLVATPGRLNDLIGQGYIGLSQLETFVLDEADRMLDMGFIHDVRRVIAQLPSQRQTLLFSATMPQEVEALALKILRDPVTVKVDPVSSTVDSIEQFLYLVDKANKKYLLESLLKKPEVESALVFTRTKHGADRVVRELHKMNIMARAIHGDKSQSARQEALDQFKKGKIAVLIATDIAARGIDISGLSHVFNHDLPNEPEAYVHRIGRTGRAGREGVAISFCCIDEIKDLRAIEKLIGKTIPRLESPWPMEVMTETVKQPRPPRPPRSERVSGNRAQGPSRDLRERPAMPPAANPPRRGSRRPGQNHPGKPAQP